MLGQGDFIGDWRITRRIDDRHGVQQGRFDGTACFRGTGADGADYTERGTLILGDGPGFVAERAYHWTFGADRVDVRFADGRAFHSFAPIGRAAGSDHPCGNDMYRVAYDFTRWPDWTAVWTVRGPAKDYTMTSTYARGEGLAQLDPLGQT